MEDYLQYRLRLKNEGRPPKERKAYRIKQFSAKRAKINREYAKVTKPIWEGKECEIKAPGCQRWATGMHHLRGKDTIDRLLNTKEMIPACNYCNGVWIEEHSKEAEELGFKLSKNHE